MTAVGLRYFNVYGPREQHKGRMASVIHHFTKQMKETGKVRLFAGPAATATASSGGILFTCATWRG